MGGGGPFRIVSYNVRYFAHAFGGLGSCRASRRRIAAALAALDPPADVICLQEVETRSIRAGLGRPPKRPGETQLEAFMDSLGEARRRAGHRMPYEAFYFPAHAFRAFGAVLYTTGLAVLVDRGRLAVEGHNAAAPAEITHHPVALLRDTKQSRVCAHVALRTAGGARFHVFNTHLSLPTPFAREFWTSPERLGHGRNQVEEARSLGAFVRERSGGEPYVLCGDFNAPPASPVWRTVTGDLGCADARASEGAPTAGFLHLRMHLDHVFCGGGTRWVDLEGTRPFGEGPFRGLSDHVPLIGRFEVGRTA